MTDAIISDIHANADALERVLADAVQNGAKRVICLGDVVGYGPTPVESVAKVRESCVLTLAGNHDRAVSGDLETTSFNRLARESVRRHRAALSGEAIKWMKDLRLTARQGRAVFAHGDVSNPADFLYVDTREDAAANFEATDAQIVFVGHTHVPKIHITGASGEVYELEPQDFVLEDGKRYIVNVGSVGYPREDSGRCYSSYVLYDDETGVVRFRALPFAVGSLLPRDSARPNRIKRIAVIGGAALIALLFAVTQMSWRKPTPMPVASTAAISAETILSRSLPISSGQTKVHAGLFLARGSARVHLTIVFIGADQREISAVHETVISSNRKGYPIPVGAVSALIEVSPTLKGDRVIVKSFNPTVE